MPPAAEGVGEGDLLDSPSAQHTLVQIEFALAVLRGAARVEHLELKLRCARAQVHVWLRHTVGAEASEPEWEEQERIVETGKRTIGLPHLAVALLGKAEEEGDVGLRHLVVFGDVMVRAEHHLPGV